MFAARPLLAVFGPHYAATGVTVLALAALAALAALPEVVVRSAIAAARVQRRAAVLGGLPAAVAGMALAGSWVLAPRLGLVGVGAALLTAETLAAAVVLAADRRATPRRARRAAWPATVTATARRASGIFPPAVRSRSG